MNVVLLRTNRPSSKGTTQIQKIQYNTIQKQNVKQIKTITAMTTMCQTRYTSHTPWHTSWDHHGPNRSHDSYMSIYLCNQFLLSHALKLCIHFSPHDEGNKLWRGEDCDPINQFHPVSFSCMSLARSFFFIVFSDFRWEMIVGVS